MLSRSSLSLKMTSASPSAATLPPERSMTLLQVSMIISRSWDVIIFVMLISRIVYIVMRLLYGSSAEVGSSISTASGSMARTVAMRPSFMDEYLSVAGNGCGGLDDYWRVIYSYPKLMGGAIWDFVSPDWRSP